MTEPIVVAIDAPETGEDALALARLLAGSPPRKLVLATVVPPTPPGWGGAETDLAVQEEGRRLLAGFATDLADAAVERHVIDWPSAAWAVSDLADDSSAAVVVLGSSRRGAAGEVRLGGVGQSVVTGAPCPVAIAPVGYRDAAPSGLKLIGVAYDGSPEADLALDFAAEIAQQAGAAMKLWCVVGPTGAHGRNPQLYAEFTNYIHHWAQSRLDLGLARVPDGIERSTEVLEGDSAEELARAAAAEGADVVVVGSRRFGPVRRVFLGSTSHRLVHEARCPVVVVPRPEHDASPSS